MQHRSPTGVALRLLLKLSMLQVKNALARAAADSGAGLLEVLLPLETLQQGAKAVHAAFREALQQHR